MIHVTCRLTAKNRDQLRNPTLGRLGNRVWATFTFFYLICTLQKVSEIIFTFPVANDGVHVFITLLDTLCYE